MTVNLTQDIPDICRHIFVTDWKIWNICSLIIRSTVRVASALLYTTLDMDLPLCQRQTQAFINDKVELTALFTKLTEIVRQVMSANLYNTWYGVLLTNSTQLKTRAKISYLMFELQIWFSLRLILLGKKLLHFNVKVEDADDAQHSTAPSFWTKYFLLVLLELSFT